MIWTSLWNCMIGTFDINLYSLKYISQSGSKSSAIICTWWRKYLFSTSDIFFSNVDKEPQCYYSWPLFLLTYNKKNLRCGELKGHLSYIKLRPTTCADLEAVCKRSWDGIKLCWRRVTQSLGLGGGVYKMS